MFKLFYLIYINSYLTEQTTGLEVHVIWIAAKKGFFGGYIVIYKSKMKMPMKLKFGGSPLLFCK